MLRAIWLITVAFVLAFHPNLAQQTETNDNQELVVIDLKYSNDYKLGVDLKHIFHILEDTTTADRWILVHGSSDGTAISVINLKHDTDEVLSVTLVAGDPLTNVPSGRGQLEGKTNSFVFGKLEGLVILHSGEILAMDTELDTIYSLVRLNQTVKAVFGRPDTPKKRSVDGEGNVTRFTELTSMVHLEQEDSHIIITTDQHQLRKLNYTHLTRVSVTLECSNLPLVNRWTELARGVGNSVYAMKGVRGAAVSDIYKVDALLEDFSHCTLELLSGEVNPLAVLFSTHFALNESSIVITDSTQNRLCIIKTEKVHQLDHYISYRLAPGTYDGPWSVQLINNHVIVGDKATVRTPGIKKVVLRDVKVFTIIGLTLFPFIGTVVVACLFVVANVFICTRGLAARAAKKRRKVNPQESDIYNSTGDKLAPPTGFQMQPPGDSFAYPNTLGSGVFAPGLNPSDQKLLNDPRYLMPTPDNRIGIIPENHIKPQHSEHAYYEIAEE